MPYDVDKADDIKSMKDKLQKTYKGVSDKAVRQAIHVFNSVMDEGGDEGKAWASVYSVMNKRGLGKKSSLRSKVIRLAATFPEGSPERAQLLTVLAADDKGKKVTIYHKGRAGGVVRVEGFLQEVNVPGGVTYIPKRGRRAQMIMTYTSPFIMVVEGWNKPEPPDSMETLKDDGKVIVQRGMFRSNDPRWIELFMDKVGKRLRPIVLIEGGRLKKNTSGV